MSILTCTNRGAWEGAELPPYFTLLPSVDAKHEVGEGFGFLALDGLIDVLAFLTCAVCRAPNPDWLRLSSAVDMQTVDRRWQQMAWVDP